MGAYCEALAGALVECALPEAIEVVEWIDQPVSVKAGGGYVNNGHLLCRLCGIVCNGISAGDDEAVIGVHAHVGTLAHIVDEQADVSQGMVFALARCAYDVDVVFVLCQ